jgi:Ca-activated chloride channel family protein
LGVVVTLAASSYLVAQAASVNEVHILPRAIPSAIAPTRETVRANVDLVLVNVTVLDKAGKAVTGLEPAQFAVLDNKNPQTIRYLSNTDDPISLVVILDSSASMAPRIGEVRKAFDELVNASNPQDDLGLIIVRDEPEIALSFNDSVSELHGALNALQPSGATSLWDAIYLGVKELKNSHYPRKAMVVISDGGDNHSRYTEFQLKSLLREADVEVYAIGLFDRFATRIEEKKGPLQLDEVTSVTGGRVFSVHDSLELSRSAVQISHELRNQYVLGYYPNNRSRDGKWRKLKIHLAGSASQGRFRLYARKGYYAASE